VLRIRYVYPGSRILNFTHPGSRIKNNYKIEGWKKICFHTFFLATNFTKFKIILFLNCWRKKFGPNFKELGIELFTQKVVTKFSKIWVWDPRSGIRKKPIPDPGSGKNLFRIPDPYQGGPVPIPNPYPGKPDALPPPPKKRENRIYNINFMTSRAACFSLEAWVLAVSLNVLFSWWSETKYKFSSSFWSKKFEVVFLTEILKFFLTKNLGSDADSFMNWSDSAALDFFIFHKFIFSRNDKRGKLPKWIQEHLKDSMCNLSTEECMQISRKWLKLMAQPFTRSKLNKLQKFFPFTTTFICW
jgi:hypothetical protein